MFVLVMVYNISDDQSVNRKVCWYSTHMSGAVKV